MPKAKIVYLHGYLDLGGAEELRRTTLKYLDRKKYEVLVCSMSTKGLIGERLEEEGTKVIALGKTQNLWDLRAYFLLYRILKREKPDVLQCCMFNSCIIGTIVGTFAGIKNIIWGEHSAEIYKKKWHILLDKILSRRAAVIITCSQFVKEYMCKHEGIPKRKVVPVLNCIDPKKFSVKLTKKEIRKELGLPLDSKIVIMVGGIKRDKGHDVLLEAWKKVISDFKKTLLLIVGEGNLREMFERFVADNNMEDSVRFLGLREDTPRLMKAADVLVLPTLMEGFGIVLLEAMVVGTLVVASNVGGIPEVVTNNKNGLLCKPGDANSLFVGIKKILSSPALAKRLSLEGKKSIGRKFHAKRYVNQLEGIYDKLCKK